MRVGSRRVLASIQASSTPTTARYNQAGSGADQPSRRRNHGTRDGRSGGTADSQARSPGDRGVRDAWPARPRPAGSTGSSSGSGSRVGHARQQGAGGRTDQGGARHDREIGGHSRQC